MGNILFNSKILTDKECDFISNFVLENEEYVKKLGPDEYSGTSEDSLTGRWTLFNWLRTPVGDILIPKIKKILNDLDFNGYYISLWANTFRNNEGISMHSHNTGGPNKLLDKECICKFICGNIFISGPSKVGTWYYKDNKWIKQLSLPGRLTLFDDDVLHKVDKNNTNDIRISLAMDIHKKELLDNCKYHECTNNKEIRFYKLGE